MLRGGIDLVARRPYPNKNYLVACRNIGKQAVNGFLIETAGHIPAFTTITRWAVGTDYTVQHQVEYTVLDDELDALSEDMTFWYASSPGFGGFDSRWPAVAEDWIPISAQPCMELVAGMLRQRPPTDHLNADGRILTRIEQFLLPTIERARMLYPTWSKMPTTEMAFQAQCPAIAQHHNQD